MKIADSSLMMASARTYSEKTEERESLQIIVREPAQKTAGINDEVSLSAEAASCKCQEMLDDVMVDSKDRLLNELKALIVEILSGRRVRVMDMAEVFDGEQPVEAEVEAQPEEGSGVGIIYHQESLYHEKEDVSFAASGVVKTADGREISFALDLEMSREFMEYSAVDVRMGDPALTDPLVINYGGNAAELSDTRFAFDLDMDGVDDNMPGLRGGSGYLALDLNEDGIINDGHELFGPESGDGFAELARYDEDGNNWIDENDAIFNRLRIWEIGPDGSSSLQTLKDKDVGAISLGRLQSSFDLKDGDNNLQGRILNSGLFLKEDGTPGTVQQLDLVV